MSIIEINNITKDYGSKRGVFGISLKINEGEVVGFLGPNGAGKTTTVRQLLGFVKPQNGNCKINGYDCWKDASSIQKNVGYVPGEISFPKNLTGYEMLERVAELRKMQNLDKARELIKYYELDPRGELKRMSKGMKQKVAIVVAFMHEPNIIVLDEPTSGLDPLMQSKFVEHIKTEKEKGKTIFMSSHMFEEVEKTCDRVEIIKQGRIITSVSKKEIEHKKEKEFEVKFSNDLSFKNFISLDHQIFEMNQEKLRVKVLIQDSNINKFIKDLSKQEVEYISEIKYTLEKYFMKYYKMEEEK